MQSHLALRTLKSEQRPDKDVQVLFAIRPPKKAIFFVHGFSGDPVKTWSEFHLLLPAAPHWHDCDMYFYGYDGLRADMNASAALFRDFLDKVIENPSHIANVNLPAEAVRPDHWEYGEVLLVAHSLGAVVVRRALLDLTQMKRRWLSKTKMLLFAPAHKGATVATLALESLTNFKFLRLFGAITRFESPLIDQLKVGSPHLVQLLSETIQARKNGKNPHLRAHRVVIAEHEKIVENQSFADDPPPITIPDTEHTTVCKPRSGFLRPLEILESCL